MEVICTGPIFDGRLIVATEGALKESAKQVADYAYDELESEFGKNFKNPTGFYESRLVVKSIPDGYSVNDQGVVYGPWLEGTGSRNKTTRFKGYSNFRRVTQRAHVMAEAVAEAVFHAALKGLI